MQKLTAEFVRQEASRYPISYDDLYFRHLERGKRGNVESLKALTEWKNPNRANVPMKFENHRRKMLAWKFFVCRLKSYLPDGKDQLRADFNKRAPVWAIFWHHVLYGTPIFDRYTHIAFVFFTEGTRLSKEEAKIRAGDHWILYDKYCDWFKEQLARLSASDPDIDERMLDRALIMFGSS
jgi:hypothetical protein